MMAFAGAVLIGVSLGLLGSGGSILTVPVLVYLAGQPEKVAIAGSLAVVAAIAAAGSLPYIFRRRVNWRSVVWFGVPGMAGTWLGAWSSQFVSGNVQLTVFALLMLSAAWFMFRPSPSTADIGPRPVARIAADGLAVGALTGLVGVGGGFLIVPALVLLGGLDMAVAVGTSLVIIGLKSLSGFLEHLHVLTRLDLELDWRLLGVFIAVGITGTFLGGYLGRRIPQQRLRQLFAAVLVIVATAILWQTLAPAHTA
ncbi:MAG TPA: sulfite exporter TauE/SafE family protein [Arenicellales bacterium]|nr:sulfite exporter TauE/SafE family protein [Arenicellales bacterium]